MALKGACEIKGNCRKEYKNLVRDILEGTQLGSGSRG